MDMTFKDTDAWPMGMPTEYKVISANERTVFAAHIGVKMALKKIMPQLPEKLRVLAAQYLDANEKSWWVRNVTASYGKLDLEQLYWIIDSKDNSITVAQRNGEFAVLNGVQGLTLASELLGKSHGAEPWRTMGVEKLGKAIISWHRDPRSYILTEAFFRKKQAVLKGWLTGREKDPEALRAVCREPIFTFNNGHWILDFNAINRRGGVERWVIQGKTAHFLINEIVVTMVKDDGTFNFPDEL